MSNQQLKASMEAINFQTQPLLLKELKIHIGDLINTVKPKTADYKATAALISQAIKKHTGMSVEITFIKSRHPNAFVTIPQIDRNHPLLTDFHRAVTGNRDGIKMVNKAGGVFSGAIDRDRSRVSGAFAEFPVGMGMTSAFLDTDFTPDEVASVLLHELGHIFTYFEYLGTNITTDYVLQHVTRELLGTREIKRKYAVLQEGSDVLGITLQDPEALTRCENETTIQTVILREVMVKRQSELNSKIHDLTAWEMLADQFSTRHGAGRGLVTGLDKIYRRSHVDEYLSTGEFLATEALKLTLFIVTTPLFLGIPQFLTMFVFDPAEDLYDKPKSRIERIRRDLVSASKDRNADRDFLKQVVEDIEVMDTVLETMEERRSLIELFWLATRSKSRHNYKQLRFQQELEMLTNNALFVQSAKLKTLSL